jgi:transposase
MIIYWKRYCYPQSPNKDTERPLPDWDYVHKELKKKSVTLFLLWQEYKETYPDGYEYSWFCRNYKEWSGKIDVTMIFNHKAGEKLFVDYAGHTIPIIDKRTGEDPASSGFCGNHGRQQLHIRGGHMDAIPAGLDLLPCKDLQIPDGSARDYSSR